MNEQETIDLEIKHMRLDYDISAYRTQVLDWRRKQLEAHKNVALARAQIADLEEKILAKEAEKEGLPKQ